MQTPVSRNTILRPSYQPPKTKLTLAKKLRSHVDVMGFSYYNRAENLEALIMCVQEIFGKAIGKKNEQAYIRAGYQKALKPFREQGEGQPMRISSVESSAYNFLMNPQYFDKTALKPEVVNQGIENLKRKAAESRAAAELFAAIHADKAFQAHPIAYAETWRKGIEQPPTVAQKKVLKRLNSESMCNRNPCAPSLKKITHDLTELSASSCNKRKQVTQKNEDLLSSKRR